MEWVETTGRTVEEAKEAALDQLGVDEQDAEFEIIEEARTGLFGRLRNEARVRARVQPTRPRPKDDRRRGRRDGADRPKSAASPEGRRAGTGVTGSEGGSGSSGGRTARVAERPAAPVEAAAGQDEGQTRGAGGAGRAGAGRGRNGRSGRADRQNGEGSSAAAGGRREEGSSVDEDVAMEAQAEVAQRFLTGLLDSMGAVAAVAIRPIDDETVELTVDGGDLGVLIGPKGATLQALQELTRTVVQRRTGARNGRLMVDVSGYRQKRREALERFTRQVATQVLESGQRKVLEPMHAADRKVVHDTVNDIDGVATLSEGEEPRRRVVIIPA